MNLLKVAVEVENRKESAEAANRRFSIIGFFASLIGKIKMAGMRKKHAKARKERLAAVYAKKKALLEEAAAYAVQADAVCADIVDRKLTGQDFEDAFLEVDALMAKAEAARAAADDINTGWGE